MTEQLRYYLIYVIVEIGAAQNIPVVSKKDIYYQGLLRRRLFIFSGKRFAAWTHVI
jgi:hypothetical protein